MQVPQRECPFCTQSDFIIENKHAYVIYDSYPVNPGHCLVIPRRHVAEYFQATAEEKAAIWSLVDETKTIIDKRYDPDGYNIGVNIGVAAGNGELARLAYDRLIEYLPEEAETFFQMGMQKVTTGNFSLHCRDIMQAYYQMYCTDCRQKQMN